MEIGREMGVTVCWSSRSRFACFLAKMTVTEDGQTTTGNEAILLGPRTSYFEQSFWVPGCLGSLPRSRAS